jgi:hypothetical protein
MSVHRNIRRLRRHEICVTILSWLLLRACHYLSAATIEQKSNAMTTVLLGAIVELLSFSQVVDNLSFLYLPVVYDDSDSSIHVPFFDVARTTCFAEYSTKYNQN